MANNYDHDGETDSKDCIQKDGPSSAIASWHPSHRHTLPVKLGCVGCSFQFGRTSICVPGGRTASAVTRASIDEQIRISGPRYLPLLLPSSAALLPDDGQHLAVERIDQ
jgi:hypothetical protein